jgi:hypothetical protein
VNAARISVESTALNAARQKDLAKFEKRERELAALERLGRG